MIWNKGNRKSKHFTDIKVINTKPHHHDVREDNCIILLLLSPPTTGGPILREIVTQTKFLPKYVIVKSSTPISHDFLPRIRFRYVDVF